MSNHFTNYIQNTYANFYNTKYMASFNEKFADGVIFENKAATVGKIIRSLANKGMPVSQGPNQNIKNNPMWFNSHIALLIK